MSEQLKQSPTLDDLRARRDEIIALAEKYGAFDVRVFGSVARGESTPESDFDLLVTYTPTASLFDVVAFWQDLQDLLNCRVDIVDDRAIKPRLRPSILRDVVPL